MSKPRTIRCAETDIEIPYRGYGRPPKYAPGVKAKLDAARRRDKRKRAAEARKAGALQQHATG